MYVNCLFKYFGKRVYWIIIKSHVSSTTLMNFIVAFLFSNSVQVWDRYKSESATELISVCAANLTFITFVFQLVRYKLIIFNNLNYILLCHKNNLSIYFHSIKLLSEFLNAPKVPNAFLANFMLWQVLGVKHLFGFDWMMY